jgi:hypothetical protein
MMIDCIHVQIFNGKLILFLLSHWLCGSTTNFVFSPNLLACWVVQVADFLFGLGLSCLCAQVRRRISLCSLGPVSLAASGVFPVLCCVFFIPDLGLPGALPLRCHFDPAAGVFVAQLTSPPCSAAGARYRFLAGSKHRS